MMQEFIDFFTTISYSTWQGIVLSSFFIPLVFYLASKIRTWFISLHPVNELFSGYRKSKEDILIFLSQLSAINNQGQLNIRQNYISRYPQPIPGNQNNLASRAYRNIDPVWSQSDGQCGAEVFNILGRIKRIKGFRIADTIKDWNEIAHPVFAIGFNPKTRDLLNCCTPINFNLENNDSALSIDGHTFSLGARYPNDAGVVQKTFVNNNDKPVFILAGLGTTGTEVAGQVLNQNSVPLGKLYGNQPFCVLFKADITRRSSHYEIKAVFPKPKIHRSILYPITFIKWHRKKIFP